MEKPYKCEQNDLNKFLESITLEQTIGEKDSSEKRDAVILSTLHNTKGLEFNKVIITGLEEGVFPYGNKTGLEMEEERRLFYVGVTRARDSLFITSTQKRFLYGHWEFVRPSRFLQEASTSFKIQGQAPFGFGSSFGRSASSAFGASVADGYGAETDAIAQKWKKGLHVYHDDYGDGRLA